MKEQFEDIKITSLDVASSRSRDSQSEIVDVVLILSASAPRPWANNFNATWKSHIYGFKRAAHVVGKRLQISCVPDELEKAHLPELKTVMAETNDFYRKYLDERQKAEEAKAANEDRKRAKLEELKKNLNFD